MAFDYPTFYYGCLSIGPDHSVSDHLNTKQVKVCYSDKLAIQMFAIHIPTVPDKIVSHYLNAFCTVFKVMV